MTINPSFIEDFRDKHKLALLPCVERLSRRKEALCLKGNNFLDRLAHEVVAVALADLSANRNKALKELPIDKKEPPLEGLQVAKKILEVIEKKLTEMSYSIGKSLSKGAVDGFAEKLPAFMMGKNVPSYPALLNKEEKLPENPGVSLVDILGESTKKSLSVYTEQEVDAPILPAELEKQIKAIQQGLETADTESAIGKQIDLYRRCIWQGKSSQKEGWLYCMHMIFLFWSLKEIEKSISNNEIGYMIYFAAQGIYSLLELRKGSLGKGITEFPCYTPKKMSVSVMKIGFIVFSALFFISSLFGFVRNNNASSLYKNPDEVGILALIKQENPDKAFQQATILAWLNNNPIDEVVKQKIIASFSDVKYVGPLCNYGMVIAVLSTVIAFFVLRLLNRGYEKKIKFKELELAGYKEQLYQALDLKQRLLESSAASKL